MEAAMHNFFGKGKRSEILKLDFFYEKPCACRCVAASPSSSAARSTWRSAGWSSRSSARSPRRPGNSNDGRLGIGIGMGARFGVLQNFTEPGACLLFCTRAYLRYY